MTLEWAGLKRKGCHIKWDGGVVFIFIITEESLDIASKAVVMWLEGQGFEWRRQPLVEMQGETAYNRLSRFGPSLYLAHNGSLVDRVVLFLVSFMIILSRNRILVIKWKISWSAVASKCSLVSHGKLKQLNSWLAQIWTMKY